MKCTECHKSAFLMSYKLNDGRVLCPACFRKIKDTLPKAKPPVAATILTVLALLFFLVSFFVIGSEMTSERLIVTVLLSFAGTGFLLVGQRIAKANRQNLSNHPSK